MQSGLDRVHEVHHIGCTPNRTPPKNQNILAPEPRTGPHLGCGPVRFGVRVVPEPDPSIPSSTTVVLISGGPWCDSSCSWLSMISLASVER